MMRFDRQQLPVFTSLSGRRLSSCMHSLTTCIRLTVAASFLAVLTAGVLTGSAETAAAIESLCPSSSSGHLIAGDSRTTPELAQDVLRTPCPAALTVTEVSGPTIAQPKRTLSIDKLCDVRTRHVGIISCDHVTAAGVGLRALAISSLIQLHIRLQV
jgi:hypothetical protein